MASQTETTQLFYRGVNTSLYSTLPTEAVLDIERAIWLKTTGQTKVAREVFENELQPLQHLPIVTIEYADFEIESGRWGKAWRILDAALKRLKAIKADLDLPEYRLMALTWVMLGVRHRGDIYSSAEQIERTRRWLWDVPVAEYTDVMTNCIRRYVIAYLFTKLSSAKYDNSKIELVPMSNDGRESEASKRPWNGLHDLRRSLNARGMLQEAISLFRVELNRTPPKDREPMIEEVLSKIADLPTTHGRDFIEASIRLQWMTTYLALQNGSRAWEEMSISEAAFNRWCNEFKIPDKNTVHYFQALNCEKLSLLQDHIIKLRDAEEYAGQMEAVGSTKTGQCLSIAKDSAIAIFRTTKKDEDLAKYFALHKRLEVFDETIAQDLCDLVHHHNDLISVTIETMGDCQKALEWADAFLQTYPYFKAPGELQSFHSYRALLLISLRRVEEAKQAEQEADKWRSIEPDVGRWAHIGMGSSSAPHDSDAEKLTRALWQSLRNRLGDFVVPQIKVEEKSYRSLPLILDMILRRLPFHLLEPHIPDGKVRARWKCRCGASLFDDFTEIESASVKNLERELQELEGSADRARNLGLIISESLRALWRPMERRLQKQGPPNSNRGNMLPLEELSQRSNVLPHSNTTQQCYQTSVRCQDSLHLLICIDKGNSGTALRQEHLDDVSTDRKLFLFLRNEYFSHWNLSNWFTVRQIKSLSLSRFALDFSNFTEVHKHVSICDPACVCLPPVDRLDREYYCRPAPEIKPKYEPVIGSQRLTHYFLSPQCVDATQKTILAQLPKKVGYLRALNDQEEIGWGIHFQEGWHWRTVYFLVVVVALVSLVFGIVWSVTKKDIQGAFAISSFCLTLGSLVLGYIVVKSA